MAAIFGGANQGPTRINQIQLNQSVLGYPLAVVMGKGRIQQSLLWVDGFTSKAVSASGKGLGGGKGATEYDYSADVIAALCAGPVVGIGDVWTGQSWLSNAAGVESYVIAPGVPFTPSASDITADQGVSTTVSYSSTQNDFGSPSPTVLSGNTAVPFNRVPYGTVPGSGQYSISPSGQYNFNDGDAGKTVQINYSYALATIKQQDNVLVPAGRTVQVGGTTPFAADGGVIYYTGPNDGVPLVKVSGTPSATGTYSVSGSGPATYHFAPGDVGVEVLITYELNNTANLPKGVSTSLQFILFEGELGQSPWSLLTSKFPGAELGYSGIAYVAYGPMDMGYSAQIQQNTFEVQTPDAWGGGIPDCSPVRCILQVLTNKVWGLGAGKIPFPVSAIDTETWGTPVIGALRTDSTATSWFAANGFFITPVMDRQETASSVISRWLEAGACRAFMSEGLLKLVGLGDVSTAGNGATWIAPSEAAFDLNDDDFIPAEDGEDTVKVSCSAWHDAYNVVQVQWSNRQNQYAPEITPESDQAAINRYGSRIEDPQDWDFITNLTAAKFAASMRVQQNVYTRNTYEFTLSHRHAEREPMDVGYITTSSPWSTDPNTGLQRVPVRITKIVDDGDTGKLTVTAEDYVFGTNQPKDFPKSLSAGLAQNLFADPGDTTAIVFEAPDRLATFKGNQIWIGATGASSQWGSCVVHASEDGDTYKPIATVTSRARLGTLDSTLPTGTDPDTTHTVVANLVPNAATLDAGTTADADSGNTLCYVDGEIIAYSACAISGADQYTMGTYTRRGQMGTTPAAHSAGASFLRLDDAVIKYTYDPSWAGKPLYLKFQSKNAYGNSAQDLSELTPVVFTVPGLNNGAIDGAHGWATKGVVGTGTSHVPVTGATNVPTAPVGNIMVADGSGNIKDSGVSLVSDGAFVPITVDAAALLSVNSSAASWDEHVEVNGVDEPTVNGEYL